MWMSEGLQKSGLEKIKAFHFVMALTIYDIVRQNNYAWLAFLIMINQAGDVFYSTSNDILYEFFFSLRVV